MGSCEGSGLVCFTIENAKSEREAEVYTLYPRSEAGEWKLLEPLPRQGLGSGQACQPIEWLGSSELA